MKYPVPVILDEGGSRKWFTVNSTGCVTYWITTDTALPQAMANALKLGYEFVIGIQKRTGVIANGKEWEAWVEGRTPGGPFWAYTILNARLQAEKFIKEAA